MSTRNHYAGEKIHAAVDAMAAHLLPIIARKKAAEQMPVHAGNSYIYSVPQGWMSDVIDKPGHVRRVRNVFDLEEAFADPGIHMLFIPVNASLTKMAIATICRRYRAAKTIFREVDHDE